MSLTDGRAKMSKSAELDNSRINLNDDPATIARKIKKCKSDEFTGLEWDNPDRPEATNLLNIYQAVTGMERDAILAEVGDLSWGGFKPRLADAVVAHLEPIQLKYAEVSADKAYLSGVLKSGAERADETATRTLDAAKAAEFVPKATLNARAANFVPSATAGKVSAPDATRTTPQPGRDHFTLRTAPPASQDDFVVKWTWWRTLRAADPHLA